MDIMKFLELIPGGPRKLLSVWEIQNVVSIVLVFEDCPKQLHWLQNLSDA